MGTFTTLVGFIALGASLAHGKVYSDLEQLGSAKETYDFVALAVRAMMGTSGYLSRNNPSFR